MSALLQECERKKCGGFLQYEESLGSRTLKYCRGIGMTRSNSTCLVSLMASSQIRSPFWRSRSCVGKICFCSAEMLRVWYRFVALLQIFISHRGYVHYDISGPSGPQIQSPPATPL